MLRNLAPILLLFMIILGVFIYIGCNRQSNQPSTDLIDEKTVYPARNDVPVKDELNEKNESPGMDTAEISILKSVDQGDRSIVVSITIPDPSLNLLIPGPHDCTLGGEV
jgi:hypothetical protein